MTEVRWVLDVVAHNVPSRDGRRFRARLAAIDEDCEERGDVAPSRTVGGTSGHIAMRAPVRRPVTDPQAARAARQTRGHASSLEHRRPTSVLVPVA